MRCEHEAKLSDWNWFITLTYADAFLPPGGGLVLKDLQDFWKRLRKRYSGVRYFAVGEYGERFRRPHYHILAFNYLPSDLVSRSRMDGKVVFQSVELEALWGKGRIDLAAFSPAAAQYVTNYVRKNFSVGGARVDFGTLPRPFQVMSRRPGIGAGFLSRFKRDIYPDGYVTRPGGSKRRAPRYYDLRIERFWPATYRAVKRRRRELALADVDKRGSRLYTLESVEELRQSFFDGVKGRPYERGE